tara:strand:+ start:3171 stop:3353 length:183 start_codon:yes stop_codon:yes gene_type:complete
MRNLSFYINAFAYRISYIFSINCFLVKRAKAIMKGIKNIDINKTTGLSLNKPILKKSLAG